jgi:O-antigen/teichoic acid export membrane protein
MFVLLGIQASIASTFSAEFAGQYILAGSILSLPASVIALATAPVFYRHLLDVEKNMPQQLPRQLILAMVCYLLIGLCVLAPIFIFGKEIFRLAFGATWEHAGLIASTLSVSYVSMFGVVGVQSIFAITRRLKLQFILEISSSMFALVGIIFCFKTMAFDSAIYCLSIIWLLKNTIQLVGCVVVAFQHTTE